MRYLFLLNPTAGKRDCTAELAPAIQAAAQRAGIPPEKGKVVVTQYAGHARELAAEAAHTAQADGCLLYTSLVTTGSMLSSVKPRSAMWKMSLVKSVL